MELLLSCPCPPLPGRADEPLLPGRLSVGGVALVALTGLLLVGRVFCGPFSTGRILFCLPLFLLLWPCWLLVVAGPFFCWEVCDEPRPLRLWASTERDEMAALMSTTARMLRNRFMMPPFFMLRLFSISDDVLGERFKICNHFILQKYTLLLHLSNIMPNFAANYQLNHQFL